MSKTGSLMILALILAVTTSDTFVLMAREFLTEEEIELVQINQVIDSRVRIYLNAAALRLESAGARLLGEVTEPGDPLEYMLPEDMLDGYYRILNSVMFNLDDAYQRANPDYRGIAKALKNLRDSTKEFLPELESLKQIAEKEQKNEMLRLIERALDITASAHEDAANALSE